MKERELARILNQNIQRGLARARQSDWHPELESDGGLVPPKRNCPSISAVSAGMTYGFTSTDEEWARGNDDFQRIVRILWRVRPVSFWMLARFVAAEKSFAFSPALRQHLDEQRTGEASVSLRSSFTAKLAQAVGASVEWSAPWTSLRDRFLSWEAGSTRSVARILAPSYQFAERKPEPFSHRMQVADGLLVELDEVSKSELRLVATRPANEAGPDKLYVTLSGEVEASPIVVEVPLVQSGKYVRGEVEIGELRESVERLGPAFAMVVSTERPPDM